MAAANWNHDRLSQVLVERRPSLGLIHAIESARSYLQWIQHEDGHWCGELEGDTILESEYIIAMYFLGHKNQDRMRKAATYIRRKALPDGGWSIYPGGPPEVSASTKAYFVLKLLGDDPESLHMKKARSVIRNLGGLNAINSFSRIYLALFGQYPWNLCPSVPPELILFPKWFPFSIHEMSAWSRAIVIPLSIICSLKPSCRIPEECSIDELWTDDSREKNDNIELWAKFFSRVDRMLKFLEHVDALPLRQDAVKQCERWMLQHFEKSDGIGAIFPPIVNSLIALRSLGYQEDHPILQTQVQELEELGIEENDSLRLCPCYSPVWDTVLAATSLRESGCPADDLLLQKSVSWVLDHEVREIGDWKAKNPEGEPGGWYFEYANEFYPDIDDTFQVLIALSQIDFSDARKQKEKEDAIARAIRWLFTMQNKDGGWGSFDRGCDNQILTHVPFADHNAMIDPSTADITGRGLEALAALNYTKEHPVVRRAIAFLLRQQEEDGTWLGRWGCNYIYGTWLALRGLEKIGENMQARRFQKAAHWIRSIQNPDGGWGELPCSYEDPKSKGHGPSTPSQTAWALMGLMATGDYVSATVLRGIQYLLRNQTLDGSWEDDFWTGTGFPEVFYLKYHLYATYFPLMALSVYKKNQLSD
ncbi:MAG: squalene--hopene cyclase [Acidobacteria bacterium]|nr:MAG: squalene--hopene cyclase [Acidobacteriota bacterium]